jgi:hypothetical protein
MQSTEVSFISMEVDLEPHKLIICIDNSAAINILPENNPNSEPAHIASTLAPSLVQKE